MRDTATIHGWKNPIKLARLVTIATWVLAAALIVAVLSGPVFFAILQNSVEGLPERERTRAMIDYVNRYAWVGGLIGMIGLAVIVLYLLVVASWLFVAAGNARTLTPEMGYGPWAALLWFLVPVANLVFPHGVIRRIWSASAPRPEDKKGGWLVSVWWAVLLVALLGIPGAQFVKNAYFPPSPLEPAQPSFFDSMGREIAQTMLTILAVALFVLVVRRITRMQIESFGVRQAAVFSDGPPAPL